MIDTYGAPLHINHIQHHLDKWHIINKPRGKVQTYKNYSRIIANSQTLNICTIIAREYHDEYNTI